MKNDQLTLAERQILLRLARQAIECAVFGLALPPVDEADLSPIMRQPGASFVTLTIGGDLRGCVGALEAYQPLVDDVREHAIAAALQDHRFNQVAPDEVSKLQIEISRLTTPFELEYDSPEDLSGCLRPHVDGVTLYNGWQRATFLPQVWEKLPDPTSFLSHLCHKMGADPDLWRRRKLRVQIYQVEEFHE